MMLELVNSNLKDQKILKIKETAKEQSFFLCVMHLRDILYLHDVTIETKF